MARQLLHLVSTIRLGEMERRERTDQVLADVFHKAPNLRDPNFKRLAPSDLANLYQAIDRHFFNSMVALALKQGEHALSFRISQRMTSTGGCTTSRFHPKSGKGNFQIAIAAQLLAQTWANRPQATVCGVTCQNMREGLFRIMEHELLHLTEMVVWRDSSCAQSRFKDMAHRLFGHRASKHQLLTHREAAAVQHGLRPGDLVQFQFAGRSLMGKINRIHKRATVLVPHPQGQQYSDGKRYLKYYVPLRSLQKQAG